MTDRTVPHAKDVGDRFADVLLSIDVARSLAAEPEMFEKAIDNLCDAVALLTKLVKERR